MTQELRKKRLQPVELGTVGGRPEELGADQQKHQGGELKRLTKGFRSLGPYDLLTPWSYSLHYDDTAEPGEG